MTVLIVIFSLFFRLVVSPSIYSGDLNNHIGWATSILKYGPSGAYNREYVGIMQPTYPPLSLYAFTASTGLYQFIYNASLFLNNTFPIFPSRLIWMLENQNVLPAFNKIIAIVSDLGIGLLIWRFTKSRLAMIFYLLNPAVWYISALWGQIESFPLFFVLLSFWLGKQSRLFLAHASFVAALLSKQSSIIFAPIFLILSYRVFGLKKTVLGLFLQFILFYIAFLPFFNSANLVWPVQVYIDRLQTGSGSNWITDHAFNPWVWFTHLAKVPDTIQIIGHFSAGLIGLFLFAIVSGLVLSKLAITNFSFKKLFLSSALMPMLAFLILTKMHERYFAPALPFLAIISTSYPWMWIVYFAVSLAHLANLYHNWWFPNIPFLVNWLSSLQSINIFIITFIIGLIYTLFVYVKEN